MVRQNLRGALQRGEVFPSPGLAVNLKPAGFDENFTFGLKAVLTHLCDAGCDVILGSRIKHRHETADNKVIDLLFSFRERRSRRLQGRNNGKVIADF